MNQKSIRGRFAPSPSGEMHLGNAWAALLAWLQIRQAGGSFILRIEDLDPERSRTEYIQNILADLRWLGLDWDEGPDIGGQFGPYRQSERMQLYKNALQLLEKQGQVYPCFCSRADIRSVASAPHDRVIQLEYLGTCRDLTEEEIQHKKQFKSRFSLRFRTPDTLVSYEDLIFGPQKINPLRELGDFIVRRSDQVPAYQLAVVVDDAEMNITHVLRGADLLTSTSRQILLYQAFNYPVPQFAHIPLLCGPDGQRLSKRHGSISLRAYRERGVYPEQIVGQLGYRAGLLETITPVKPTDLIPLFQPQKIPRHPIIIDLDFQFTGRKGYASKV